ncbi:hypothetical protein D3C79_821290 [compost metagenome]
MVDGSQQVERGHRTGIAAYRLPVGRVAPTLVDGLQGVFIRGRLCLEWQRAGSLGQQAAVAGQFHVQALGKVAKGLVLARLGQVLAQRLVHILAGQALAIPLGNDVYRAWQAGDHFRVADALVQQRRNRHQEHQQKKQRQRRDQRLRLPAVDPLGVFEALLETWTCAFVEGHCNGHGELRKTGKR